MSFSVETLKILSIEQGLNLDVWYYKPSTDGPHPVVVAGHGLTLVKKAGLAPFAEAWATEAGYASLVLDYRYFGESDGQPRSLTSLSAQLEDYKTVIAWARARPAQFRTDKIVVMGSASSGLHVASLVANDPQLAGGMAHCPMLDAYAIMSSGSPNLRILFWAIVDYIKGKLGLKPVFIPAVGRPGKFAFMTTPSSEPGFQHMWAETNTPYSQYPNVLTPRLLFEFMAARPGLKLKDTAGRMLVVMAEKDDLIPASITRDVVAGAAEKVEFVISPGGHFDVVKGGQGYETNIKAQISFLKSLL
ncbi:alpha/beta-hydrolase [Heliocybe sulcata]|uniref:Alpha/beta-hydrolase n=1 Tax=Heliocybe sulcata TaxID=5364 RepID=A0A5C3N045_9AGAM|nr:alpha/beta-hydrolase [Heliocybe sulcata]